MYIGTNCSLVLFFCMWLSNFPTTTYWRGFLFSIVGIWLLCQKLFAHKHVGLFLSSRFCSISLCVCFSANTIWIIVALYDNLKWGNLMPPASFFFHKITLAIRSLLWFCANLMIFSSISLKNIIGIFMGIVKSVYCLGSYGHINYWFFQSMYTKYLFFSLCILQFLLIISCSFQCIGSSHFFVNFIPRYFIFHVCQF